jgi:streptogramin lyase
MSPGCCFVLSPVFRLTGEEWTTVTTTREFSDIAFADNGEVWMVDNRGINRFVDGEWESVLAGVSVREIAVSGEGEIWAAEGIWGEMGGLWHHDGGTWRLTQPGEAIHSLNRSPDGTVWALQTRSDGATHLLDLSTGRIRFVTESATSGDMAIGTDGTIWIGGEGRLYRVDPLY